MQSSILCHPYRPTASAIAAYTSGMPQGASVTALIVEDASDAVTRFTPLFSLTGWPALSVPCGQNRDGLPLGIQIAARPGDDEVALAVAHAYEQMTPWHLLRPPEITSS